MFSYVRAAEGTDYAAFGTEVTEKALEVERSLTALLSIRVVGDGPVRYKLAERMEHRTFRQEQS